MLQRLLLLFCCATLRRFKREIPLEQRPSSLAPTTGLAGKWLAATAAGAAAALVAAAALPGFFFQQTVLELTRPLE